MNEISEKLREARIEKGYTLDDLQQITKIQKRYLIAIEDGNFKALPGDFYVRAFVKQYADTVGLDGDELLNDYSETIPQAHSSEYAEKVSESQTRSGQHLPNETVDKIKKMLPSILVILIVIIILGVVYAVATNYKATPQNKMIDDTSFSSSTKAESSSKATESSESKAESVSESKQESSSSVSKKAESKTALVSDQGDTTTFEVSNAETKNTLKLTTSSGDSWITVTQNGTALWSGVVNGSTGQDVPLTDGATAVTVRMGNSQVTKLQLNGKDFEFNPNKTTTIVKNIVINFKAKTESN